MTADDSARDDARRDADDASDPDAQPQPPLDEEAAWQLIVANYGERPRLDTDKDTGAPATPVDTTTPGDTTDSGPPPAAPRRPSRDPFDRSYLDAMDAGRSGSAPRQDRRRNDPPGPLDVPGAPPTDRDGEEHFVPPEPPPVPRATPSRRLAWCGLFLPPLLMLAAVVLDWTFPSWVTMGLVAAFIGGFVFLVATMPRDGGDGWGDGAVV